MTLFPRSVAPTTHVRVLPSTTYRVGLYKIWFYF